MDYVLNLENYRENNLIELNSDELNDINGGWVFVIPVAVKVIGAIVVGVPTVIAGVSFAAGVIDGYGGK